MYKRIMTLLAMMLVAVPLLVACGGETATPTAPAPAATATTEVSAQPTDTAGAAEPTDTAGVSGEKGNLQIIWFAWPPCTDLGTLSKTFPEAEVEVRCVPIDQWRGQIFTDFVAKAGADIVILDSQFIGEAVVGGHVMDLTEWMKTNIETEDYVPAALTAYGEYPSGSGKFYGIAAEGDTQMLVYRKDLFDRDDVKADFKAKAGKDLALPKTWTELLEIAKFFKESGGKYGVQNGYTTHWCGTPACYDQMATHWNQILWSFGGELWDPTTYKVEGVLNTDAAVQALTLDRELFKTGPEGQANFDFSAANSALCDGTTAMETVWFGFGAGFVDKAGCKNSDNLGFAVVPGEKEHFLSLGGMGLSVSNYSKNKDLALSYVKWFESKEIQLEWAKLGGFSARKSVLASDEFKNARPYNPAFAESYLLVKDFWNIPEYSQMLVPQMELLNKAVSGQVEPKAALDEIAQKQQDILDEAYPNGPPK